MNTTCTGELLNNAYRHALQVTERNMQLQQELLSGWSRFWPGFSGRGKSEFGGSSQFQEEIHTSVLNVAHTQRELIRRQFDAAIDSFELLMGVSNSAEESPVEAATPAPAAARTVVEEPAAEPEVAEDPELPPGAGKNIYQKVAVVTGAASGIGEAVAWELAKRGAKAVMLVDRSEQIDELASKINEKVGREVAIPKAGDTTDQAFRKRVFNDAWEEYGPVSICVPAAGITRDALAVKINKETGQAELYPIENFRQVTEVNLLAPIYWGIEMVARIAEDRRARGLKQWEPEERVQGVVVFLGSVSSQGNKGQISYAVAKAGLEGAAATLQKEAIFHGVRCGIIHPGFTDTPMARSLGDDFLNKYVLPYTQLRRLIRPEEIADAICFMVSNSAVSGELWADAGWHPPA